jgi:hypothetical protein
MNMRLRLARLFFPSATYRVLTKKEFQEMTGKIKGSADAATLFHKYMSLFNIVVAEDTEVEVGAGKDKWHFHIMTVLDPELASTNKYIVVFKRQWLYDFAKMFNLDTKEQGTGLNSEILKYANTHEVKEAIIIRPNGEMYLLRISDLISYTKQFNTLYEWKGTYEFHCPLGLLTQILDVIEEGDEIEDIIRRGKKK